MEIRGREARFHCLQASGPSIHFSHANGLPFRTYKSFLEQMAEEFSICGLDSCGAWPESPDPRTSDTWDGHASDLIDFLDQHYKGSPVIGMGHSMGGTISLVAATKRPDLFHSLVLIDSATSPHWFADYLLQITPRFISRRVPLIRKTANRRRLWESRDEFIKYHQSRRAFRQFTAESMIDYAEGGLRPGQEGKLELVFSPAWEAHNFQTTPCIWGLLSGITVPTLFLTAEHSYVYDMARLRRKSQHFSAQVDWRVLPRLYHLAPQQDPVTVANEIVAWLKGR